MIQRATTINCGHREDTRQAHQQGVELAIQSMYERFTESITLDDLAGEAFMSRYHFGRVFSSVTGVSPARFLAAIRMQEAKQLLLCTRRNVTCIAMDCGYKSLGTFTRTFTDSVGFSPRRFRHLGRLCKLVTISSVPRLLRQQRFSSCAGGTPSTFGILESPCDLEFAVAAVFPTVVPKSIPSVCTIIEGDNSFGFPVALPREGYLLTVGLLPGATMNDALLGAGDQFLVGRNQLDLRGDEQPIRITLRRHTSTDPPLVLALPILVAQKHFHMTE